MAKQNKKEQQSFRINEDIRIPNFKDVRLIGEGESRVMTMKQARDLAEEMELDLIEVNSKIDVPLVRIDSYGKFLYELKKKQKAQKQQTTQLKEIQLSVNIAKHDLDTKANQAKRFLEEGHKVKVVLSMRGRELSRREESKRSLLEFLVSLEEEARIESAPRDEGNRTIAILSAKKGKK